jgi:two-component system chemotaxis sensor kinase CheA
MQDAELIEGFIADSREMIDEVEPYLIELQKTFEAEGTVDGETLNTIFRLFHSLKGAAGFLHLKNVTMVTHEAETLLNHLREGKITLSDTQLEVIFKASDFIRMLLSNIEENGNDKGFESEAGEVVGKLRKAIMTQIAAVSTNEQPITNREQHAIPPDESPASPLPATTDEEPAETDEQLLITADMKQQFIEESDELLEKVEQNLLDLEGTRKKSEALANAFRNIHSFKGNCGFFGYPILERLSHKSETVLELMKNGAIDAGGDNISVLLKIVDMLRGGIAEVSEGGQGVIQGCDLLLDLLDDMIPTGTEEQAPEHKPIGEILIERGDATPEAVASALAAQGKPLGEILVDMGKTSPKAVQAALSLQEKQGKEKKITHRDIRVDLDKLNELNDLVGELVTAQTMVVRNPDLRGHEFENFEKAAHHLEQISAGLQDVAMSLRMIPVSGLFRKMMRLVHDLSRKSGKKVDLRMKGEETEVDKTVIEVISDPLVHIIRNSVDHGIEPADEREHMGKDSTGVIELEAKHEGGEVWITIRDDGRGLDRERILAKAMEKGIIDGDEKDIPDKQVFGLIFEPGFSTAEKVTDISGRGVGMDVVRKNIDQLKGRVDVQSSPGQGATISIRIPLTLAIIEGMLVKSGESRHLIPLLAIKESFRPKSEHVTVMPGGQEMVRVREELIPVARLSDVYHLGNGNGKLDEGTLIILENQGKSMCLFIDEILGQMETVIKGLPGFMGSVQGVSGCTILGDGEVSLILDVGGLMERAKH